MSSLSSVALRCGVRIDCAFTPTRSGPGERSTRVVAGWREDSPLAPPDAQSKKKKSKRNRRKEGAKPRVEGGGKGEVDGAELNVIDLGQGKSVSLYVPTNVAEVEGAVSAGGVQDLLDTYKDALYGAGDVVWPASIALGRLIAHCPSLVQGKSVLEIGSGLGLCGCVAAHAGASRVVMTDVDAEMLQLAAKSAAANVSDGCHVETRTLDWGAVNDWPEREFDVVIAADVLYDGDAAAAVAAVAGKCLKTRGGVGSMALVCDPSQRGNREAFVGEAGKVGLECVDADFPGHPNMRLLQATRVELSVGA